MEDKDLDISFASLKNSCTSFFRFTQTKRVTKPSLVFGCTILLRPSLPRTFNMLSETQGSGSQWETRKQETRRRGGQEGTSKTTATAVKQAVRQDTASLKVTPRTTSRYWQFAVHGCQVLNLCFCSCHSDGCVSCSYQQRVANTSENWQGSSGLQQ